MLLLILSGTLRMTTTTSSLLTSMTVVHQTRLNWYVSEVNIRTMKKILKKTNVYGEDIYGMNPMPLLQWMVAQEIILFRYTRISTFSIIMSLKTFGIFRNWVTSIE